MTRYVLLLRGVNVGTKNSLPMATLRTMLTEIGCADVQTYVQSGNAVFGTKLAQKALCEAIEAKLEGFMGRPIATTVRTLSWGSELLQVVGKEIYTWHPDGQGRSPLAAALAKLPLRGAVTTRNWNTVQKLLAMLEASL
jgi:uncharacterized protein (DUF1697 family)